MLCYEEIIEEQNAGNILIEPFNEKQLNTNSYDVCLGNWFIQLGSLNGAPLYSELFFVPDGNSFPIVPFTTTLGMTKEIVGAQNHIVHQLRSKSSTRRKGITVCDDAGFGDVGYSNHWTVELNAHTMSPIFLRAGEPFGQIVFERTGMDTEHSYSGQYNEDDWPLCMIPKSYRDFYSQFYIDARYMVSKINPLITQHFRFREWNLFKNDPVNRMAFSYQWVEPYYS